MCFRVLKRRSLLREEGGWALMDAVWSSVIVVMAFMASTAAFDNATKSSAREGKNTQALAVAQSQLNWMRSVGQANQSDLIALNGTTRTIPYRGTNFTVRYKAEPTAGLGEAMVQACSVSLAASGGSTDLPDNNRYINMRVVVSYPGQVVGTGGPTGTGPNAAEPIALDSNFAAERAAQAVITGMLRVYVVDRNGQPANGVNGVTIKLGGTTYSPTASNTSMGCYLFTDVQAGTYQIQVATTKQDIYLGNTNGMMVRDYAMPSGELRSTSVTIEAPISVVPTYKAHTAGSDQVVDPTSNSANPFVKGPGGLGYWIGNTSEVLTAYNSSFFVNPGGAFFPSSNSPVADKRFIYPPVNGYAAYAGPCRVNDPESNWAQIPNNPSAVLWLTQLKPTATMTSIWTSKLSVPGGVNLLETKTFYWGQTSLGGQVQVALVGATDGSATPTECNAGHAVGQDTPAKWKRIGDFGAGSTLDEIEAALPTGRYAVCVRLNFRYTTQQFYGGLIGLDRRWLGNEETYNDGVGYLTTPVQTLGFAAAPVVPTALNFSAPSTSTKQAAASTTSCGDPAKWS